MGISANFAQIVLSALIVVILTVHQTAQSHPSATTAQEIIQQIPTYAQHTLLKDQKSKSTLKMSTIRILQLNTQCLSTSKAALIHYQEVLNPDIICLQETWTTEKKIPFKDWTGRNRTIYTHKSSGYGVATLVHPRLKNVFREDLYHPEIEAIWNEFEFNDSTITLGNFYIPPKDLQQLQLVDNQLLKVSNPNAIVLGDFNSRNLLWEDNARYSTNMGKKVEEILGVNDFVIQNSGANTCHTSNGNSAVDITASRGIELISWTITPLDLIKTVHDGILITIHLERARLSLHKPLRFKTKDADWENWSQVCNEKGKDFQPIPNNASEELIDYHINNLTSNIIELAKEHLGCQRICQKSKQWFNRDVR